jgi:hypothetical protein
MMKFPTEWKNQSHVPNHQPEELNPQLVVLLAALWNSGFSLS